ncbi:MULTISPECIES: peptidoglycan-binding domain-containing protein [Metabacillus]|uniref:Peptidoglycan binding-like domain-containing protein n=3 Tax=Metabacillus TaxID=2675233 RepID=A0A179T0W6_9BACI|nr:MULTISPECIES: peptidoglycan-binding domain-containing protein [Metabacillus]OAS86202.1 hypothetical protein A6K24_22010 [Metabacillus litoralis]
MGKIFTVILGLVLGWSCYMGQVLAEGTLDIPSQTYTDQELKTTIQLQSTSNNYIRAFTCNGNSSWTKELQSESSGYTWIINQGVKGYIQEGYSGGKSLGVVLNNTKIDFDYSYLAKKGYAGNKNSYVKGIQATLSCLGYSPGTIDGIFGAKTESAVKAFQQRKGLSVDGIVGKQTYHYLSFASS